MNYRFLELKRKIFKFLCKLLPRFVKKRNKKFSNIYFKPTDYSKLPQTNYVNKNSLDFQNKLISKFNHNLIQNSFMTCPHLIQILLVKFNTNEEINFLDIGADNIDFYLQLNKNFKNLKYFFYNLKSVNTIFKKLKLDNNYENLIIIDEINDEFKQQFEFINFGSSIQYFENYEFILKKTTDIGKNIMFSGTSLYETTNIKYKKHMIVEQINMFPDINYLYFFNKQNFYQVFLDKNYKLLFENKNLTDGINYTNFDKIFKNINYMDFLFTKNN